MKNLIINGLNLIELKGSLPFDFVKAVSMLQRPYIEINKETFDKIKSSTESDFFLYGSKVVTFGAADGGYALMPLNREEQTRIKEECSDIIENNSRKVFFVQRTVMQDRQFVVCIAEEGIKGYSITDWLFGSDFNEATKLCDEKNEAMGISREDALMIQCSTM